MKKCEKMLRSFGSLFAEKTTKVLSPLFTPLYSSVSSPSPFYWFSQASGAATASRTVDDGLGFPIESSPKAVDPTLLQPGVVVYDGVCHLCHRGVKWVIRADRYRKIKFCCLQSQAAEPYLKICGLTREDVLRCFLFVEGPGLYYQGSTAALKVASHLPLPYSALSGLLIIPAPLRDAVYDYIANKRYYWFGKEDECIVLQEKEMLERFIDRDEHLGRQN